jgi:hypothetical protein
MKNVDVGLSVRKKAVRFLKNPSLCRLRMYFKYVVFNLKLIIALYLCIIIFIIFIILRLILLF